MLKVILSILLLVALPVAAQDRYNVIRIFTKTGIIIYSGCDIDIESLNMRASCTSMEVQRQLIGPTLSDHKLSVVVLIDGKTFSFRSARLVSTSIDSRSATFDFDFRDKEK